MIDSSSLLITLGVRSPVWSNRAHSSNPVLNKQNIEKSVGVGVRLKQYNRDSVLECEKLDFKNNLLEFSPVRAKLSKFRRLN